jgi:hypothetical protein
LQNTGDKNFVSEKVSNHPSWVRLNDQLGWYDRKSGDNQKRYKQIKKTRSWFWQVPYRSSRWLALLGAGG